VNVAAAHPEIVEWMKVEMAVWREKVEAERLSGDDVLEGINSEELERLRSLGYVG
jgi:hypothetical protein